MYYGPMKAILRTHQGYVREMAIYPPAPEFISMAVSSSGAQIWNPGDLMVGEQKLFKTVKFIKTTEDRKDNSWLYVQEGEPDVKIDDLYKAMQKKLQGKIEEQITKSNSFYNMMKKKEEEKLTSNEIVAICENHKKNFCYGHDIENEMVKIGQKDHPLEGEKPYEYLTRLMNRALSQKQQNEIEKLKAIADYQSEVQAKANEELEKFYAGQQWKKAYQTNVAPEYNKILQQAAWGDPLPYASPPPKSERVEEKKPRLPDPVEPRKRLMRKSS